MRSGFGALGSIPLQGSYWPAAGTAKIASKGVRTAQYMYAQKGRNSLTEVSTALEQATLIPTGAAKAAMCDTKILMDRVELLAAALPRKKAREVP
jgi:hypothetical protein